jgi:hypothetical protein
VGEGYPDTGTGRFAQELSYEQWFRFNVNQRLHLNFLETIIFFTLSFLIISTRFPLTAAYLAVGYFAT